MSQDQDLLTNLAEADLGFLRDLHKQHFNLRGELHELIDQLEPDTQVVLIIKRPVDHSIAYKTYGVDERDAVYMLSKATHRIMTPSPAS